MACLVRVFVNEDEEVVIYFNKTNLRKIYYVIRI
nr:MAG TPA: hypothetical protein [Caudoviricetes sp.]